MTGFYAAAQAIHDRQAFVARQSELAALLAQPRRDNPGRARGRLNTVRQRLIPLRSRGECTGTVV